MKRILNTLLVVFGLFTVTVANANVAKPNAEATKSYIVIEHNSGKILDSYNSNLPQYPASLTKIMTLYILFDEIKAKRISLDDKFTVSKLASKQIPSKIGLKEGEQIKVSEVIDAMIIKSANDAAVVVAENVAGSVENFADMMNKKAKELNLKSTNFTNPSGLPDKRQVTTARDVAVLAKNMIDNHGDFYYLFSREKAEIKGKTYRNHNTLLGTEGIDGLKTGYTHMSGFHIAVSSETSGVRLTAVYMGYKSSVKRNQTAQDIIKTNFQETIYTRLRNDVKSSSFYTPDFLVDANQENIMQIAIGTETEEKNLEMDTRFHPTEAKILGINENKKLKKEKVIEKEESLPITQATQHTVSSEEVMKDMIQVSDNVSNAVANSNDTATISRPKLEPQRESDNSNQELTDMYYIQLGAFASEDTARTIILQAKKLVGIVRQNRSTVERVQLRDGKELYRAIINTNNEVEAKQACGVIKNSGNECLVKARKISVEI